MEKKIRRYDIDWIRVIVFDILIIYHIGMFFVPWDFELKNNEIVDWMRWPMLFVNRWRLPLLFVISGFGTRYALSHRSGNLFVKERVKRLLVPLVAGILIIIVPQIYLVRLSEGLTYSNYFGFYPKFFNFSKGVYGTGGNFSWGHLWFLPYLFLMSVFSVPLFLHLRKKDNATIRWFKDTLKKHHYIIYIFVVPLLLVEILLERKYSITHALIGDWYALAHYYICFVAGFTLACLGSEFWNSVNKLKSYSLLIALVTFPVMIWSWYFTDSYIVQAFFKITYMWSSIMGIYGYAATYLNVESKIIKYRNQAVYPFYILHMTISLIIGFWLMNSSMHYAWKFIIMTIGTFGGCFILYEYMIKKYSILHPLFGIKNS